MHRFFVPQLYNEEMTLTGVDARHISKVLRMQPGAQLQIVSDDGVSALAEITEIDSECVTVRCLEKLAESHEPAVRLVLAQGLAKGEKMDFIIQKAVEMGAYSVVPVAMEHSVVRLDGAKAAKKVERWQKIAASAAEQSGRGLIPEVLVLGSYASALRRAAQADRALLFYEHENTVTLHNALESGPWRTVSLLTGPEGGLEEREVSQALNAGLTVCTLGRRILRCETAPLCALSAVMYAAGEY